MKTKKTHRFSISDKIADISIPSSWEELTDEEMFKVFRIMNLAEEQKMSQSEALTLILVALLELKIIEHLDDGWLVKEQGWFKPVFLLKGYEIHFMVSKLKFVFETPSYPVRPAMIRSYLAADAALNFVPFKVYITCDNLFRAYLATKETKFLAEMVSYLYDTKPGIRLTAVEAYAMFYWWYSLKEFYSNHFSYLFSPSSVEGSQTLEDIESSSKSLIRALTKGDVTKEKEIYELSTYDCLYELNQKAKEIEEQQKSMKK